MKSELERLAAVALHARGKTPAEISAVFHEEYGLQRKPQGIAQVIKEHEHWVANRRNAKAINGQADVKRAAKRAALAREKEQRQQAQEESKGNPWKFLTSFQKLVARGQVDDSARMDSTEMNQTRAKRASIV